jgi:hypothetical protein
VICSVPMHTALRLMLAALTTVRARRPELRVALHGLYAPVGASALRAGDLAVAGEGLEALAAWATGPTTKTAVSVRVELGRNPTRRTPDGRRELAEPTDPPGPADLPDRSLLSPLGRYARLIGDGPDRLVGTVEATRGCAHRCRHCPVPTVYDGRTRPVPPASVAADIAQLVAAGAGHIHFADPDFLNRPAHALTVARGLAAAFPGVSFDATIKVSHLLRHREAVAELGELGCVFVVSAIESLSPVVLDRLDKGHTPEEAGSAVDLLRAAGIEPRPSFLPFTPWTTLEDVVALLDFVARFDLVESVDPVQYGIRLLLPPGSLLLAANDPVLAAGLGPFDPAELGYPWTSPHLAVDRLQSAIAARTEAGAAAGEPFATTYAAVRALTFAARGVADPGPPAPEHRGRPGVRPHLSETWFCCAEPTSAQFGALAGTG